MAKKDNPKNVDLDLEGVVKLSSQTYQLRTIELCYSDHFHASYSGPNNENIPCSFPADYFDLSSVSHVKCPYSEKGLKKWRTCPDAIRWKKPPTSGDGAPIRYLMYWPESYECSLASKEDLIFLTPEQFEDLDKPEEVEKVVLVRSR